MQEDRAIVAIDVGTTKVCALVGELANSEGLRVLGVGARPSHGLRKGIVIDLNQASQSIVAAVDKAQRTSGMAIKAAYMGITGAHISCRNSKGVVAVSRSDHVITHEDVHRAVEAARAVTIPANCEILHVIPRSFVVDGQEGIRDPVGLKGIRLEVEVHIVTGATTSIQNLVQCAQRAKIEVSDLVLEPLASSEAVLAEEEKELGVVLADVGGGTTDIAIFIGGNIWYSKILPVGGNHLTSYIAFGLRLPFATAEDVKIRYGHALADTIPEEETFEVAGFGSNHLTIRRRQLAAIIEPRVREIYALILNEIKRSGYDGLLPAGVVLTGGTASLAGMAELGREELDLPLRIGSPHSLSGLADTITGPAYATSVGLLLWALRQNTTGGPPESATGSRPKDLWGKIMEWLRSFLPRDH
jgi:cell division protein FtsA